jgi:hypothetical protein
MTIALLEPRSEVGVPTMSNPQSSKSVEELLPLVREVIERTGVVPSRNRLMAMYGIGAPKAMQLRELAITGHPDMPVSPAGPGATLTAAYVGHPDSPAARPPRSWPLFLIALPAFVAVWSGWVGLGGLTGFGVIHPFPGIADHIRLNTAITLPVGVEVYAAYAIRVWVSERVSARARRFARVSTIIALCLGAAGQIAYHLMASHGVTVAPWWVTTIVSSLPVAVVFAGAMLAHLVRGRE